MLPEHVYSQGDFKTNFISRAVGSGPYRLVRRVAGQQVLLERRPEYWGPHPYLQRVLFKVITDDATAWAAMKRGEIDETIIPTDSWFAESRRPELQKIIDFRRFYMLDYNYIPWNTRDPILSEKRLRRALAMCIDLKSIIENLYHGTARAMNGPFTPDQWAYNPEVPVIEYNPQEALRTHEPALHRLAGTLLEQEVVEREQIADIIAVPSPPAPVGAGGDGAQGSAVGT